MLKPSRISFGGTAAIVTSMALIAGLDAARAQKTTMVSALLIAAIADNLTDSLSVHMYQESQKLAQREVFFGTLANFSTRLLVCLSFVGIVMVCPDHYSGCIAGYVWGMLLLSALTCLLARQRNVSMLSEVGKHLGVALAVIFVSREIGQWISEYVA